MRDLSGGGSGSFAIPEVSSDPGSPSAGDAWVLRTGSGGTGGGEVKALFPLILTANSGGSYTYELSYYTEDSTIVRTTLA